ncbi:MAG: DUF3857 domain-containing protein [Saprospiraceae bacterium]|nr:DUF3857 domain-containing protein [Saprospiraceae bacterium]
MYHKRIAFTKILFLVSILSNVYSQSYKYGKVTPELLKMTYCEMEKDAEAMITHKSGVSEIVYNEQEGFKAYMKKKIQCKIFNNENNDAGTISFYYYSPTASAGKVKASVLKGKTYNLENGNVKQTNLDDKNIFHVQYNNYYKKTTIVLPEVRNGSVIEYEYTLISDFFSNMNDWDVQEEYPVLYNEFKLNIPEYYKFQINLVGGVFPESDKTYTQSKNINYKNTTDSRFGRESELKSFSMTYENRELIFKNVPSFKSEPYMANPDDGKSKISLQLIYVQFPNSAIDYVAGSYEKITNNLLDSEYFGKIIKEGKFIESYVDLKNDTSILSKANTVYDYFSKNIAHNRLHEYTTKLTGKKLMTEGNGDVGDINLNYIAALNHVGVKTFPVILSTRGNGTLHPTMPDYSDFNYVVAASLINDNIVFSDATSQLSFGYLPSKCSNGPGWVISDNPMWISLDDGFKGKQIVQSHITLTQDNILYKTNINQYDYLSFDNLVSLKSKGSDSFLKTFNQNNSELTLDSTTVLEVSNNILKLKNHYSLPVNDDNILYITPFLHLPFESNPFKSETRNSLINFPFSMEYKYVSSIKIMDNQKIEIPENINLVLNDNQITFKYITSYSIPQKILTLNVDFKILETLYQTDEYDDLKNIFNTVLSKLNEQIVIKKL